ncbi:gem-associated protein 6-like isoform X2 [Ischnura elegans]|uniref:gem-associated protein 6-like isoform X2 n=1 Tax=Ischnura elegans TaxID=197161 RepID=UPI001ED87976|nr:gem-associated protein 6-like isoform X2 [Ischnura elegans]
MEQFGRKMDSVEITPTDSTLLKKDPVHLRKLVDCVVKVTSVDGKQSLGLVYTIDPVSNSVVLLKTDGSAEVIVGHSVKHIEPSYCEITIPHLNILSQEKEEVDGKVCEASRVKLKNWLLENRIPIEEEGDVLVVNNILKIYPPYGCDQCVCTNTVMLDKVHRLISQMLKVPGTL